MKTEELTALGLNEDQVKEVFRLHGKEVNPLKDQVTSLTDQLNTTKEALKAFDGVDPEALNQQIADLNQKLQDNDAAWQRKIAERDFNDMLTDTITKAGGRNAKAIAALMDLQALKESKNQKEDIQNAIENIKSENDYLFVSDEPINNAVAKTNSKNSEGDQSARRSAARKAMGLPEEE